MLHPCGEVYSMSKVLEVNESHGQDLKRGPKISKNKTAT